MLHPLHIHGLAGSTKATCPPPSAARDDGVLTLGNSLPFHGPVLLPLTPFPMPTKERSITMQPARWKGISPICPTRAVIVHGSYVDGEFVATLAAACSEIE